MNRLFWITGLAGAGKTTIARALVESLRDRQSAVVLLDGDELREVLSMTDCHGPADRLHLAKCYARLGRLLHSQGVNVVCATISPFPAVRHWLRNNVQGYIEVFIRASQDTLRNRDQKGLYSSSDRPGIINLVGHDIPFVEPVSPDCLIDNEPGTFVADHVQSILHCLGRSKCYSA